MKTSYSQVISSNYNATITKVFLAENYGNVLALGGSPTMVRRGESLLVNLAGKLKMDPAKLRKEVTTLWQVLS